MTQIILVRHGQTPWNLDKIFRGSKDIPLNDQGREEARLAGEWRGRPSTRPMLPRCPGPGTPPTPLPGTTILGHGPAGAHRSVLRRLGGPAPGGGQGKYAELYRQWETAPHTVRFPRGETLDEVRVGPWRRWRRWYGATPAKLSCWRPTGR